MKQIAIFASGAGSNAKNIIEYLDKRGHSNAQVSLIVCNKPGAGVLNIAADNNIPSIIIDKEKFFRGNGYVDELKAANIDFIVATLNWLNITLRKMGRQKDAEQHLKAVSNEMEIIENHDYFDILMMHKTNDESKLAGKIQNQETLSNATLGYTLGTYYQLKGNKDKTKEVFEKVVAGKQWSSFGYIAAEVELARMK